MRTYWILALCIPHALFALDAGARYDFFCDHGQDIINAELTGEDDTHYFVKLSVMVNKVPIEKKNVLRTVLKAPAPAKPIVSERPAIGLSAWGGLGLGTGRLADFSAVSPALGVLGSYILPSKLNLVLRGDFLRFASGSAALRILGFTAGAQIKLPYSYAGVDFFAGGAIGFAYLYALTDVYREHSLTPMAMLWLSGSYKIQSRLAATGAVSAVYIYDRSTFVLVPGICIGISYQL